MIKERNRAEGLSGAPLCCLVALSMLFMPGTLMAEATWLAGDHHIHSNNSVGWDESNPPKPIFGAETTVPLKGKSHGSTTIPTRNLLMTPQ